MTTTLQSKDSEGIWFYDYVGIMDIFEMPVSQNGCFWSFWNQFINS